MASHDERADALRSRLGRTVASLLAAGGPAPPAARRPDTRPASAPPPRGTVSEERLLRALAREMSRLMAEENRRGAGG